MKYKQPTKSQRKKIYLTIAKKFATNKNAANYICEDLTQEYLKLNNINRTNDWDYDLVANCFPEFKMFKFKADGSYAQDGGSWWYSSEIHGIKPYNERDARINALLLCYEMCK